MRPFLTLHDPARARGYYDSGQWRRETFYDLLALHAESTGSRPALRDGRARLDWRAVRARVDATAAQFARHGLVAGDVVSLWMSNRAEAVIVFLACARNGYACNPSLHRTYTADEIVGLLNRLRTRILITEPGWGAGRPARDFASRQSEVPSLAAVLAPEALPAGGDAPVMAAADNPDAVAYLAFTSGTTGAPKCVMHSHNTLLANARDLVRDWHHDAATRLLTLSPLSHHIAWVAVAQWLLTGCELITDDPPPGLSRLDWVTDTGATYVMGVPTHAIDLLAEQRRRDLVRLGSVSVFYMAGAAIPPALAEAFMAQGVLPQNVYGMTENSSHHYTRPDDPADTIITTCGRGGGAYEVTILSAEDPDCAAAPGEIGQIAGRGAALMLGYYANQDATAASFNRDGWFLSGDLGTLDSAGNLRIVGRLKDLIIRGGHNIYPAHIEALALRHPEAGKVAVLPVPDARLGERVCIAVTGAVTAESLLTHLDAAGLSLYDMPEYFVRLDAFPLTASGKILKRELAERVRRGDLVPQPVRLENARETAQ